MTLTANGFLYKPNLGASGSSERTLVHAGLDRVDTRFSYTAYVGDPNYLSFASAVAALNASATDCTLVVPAGTHDVSVNLTVNSNICLRVLHGADIVVANTQTLTINGPMEAGPYQIFSGAGSVVYGTTVYFKYGEWSGTTGPIFASFPVTPSSAPTADYQVANKKYVDNVAPTVDYIHGLEIKNNVTTPDTNIDVDADIVTVTDGTTYLTLPAVNLTIDCTGTGANGLDSGALGVSEWYYIYVISKADGTQAGLMSLSATAPSMPTGYTFKKLVGAVITDTSVFLGFHQFDTKVYYPNGLSVAHTVLTAGNEVALTAIDLSGFVPPSIVKTALVNMEVQQTGAGIGVGYVSYDNSGTFFDLATETAVTNRDNEQISIPIIVSQTIYYKVAVTGGAAVLYVTVGGFELKI